jgi:hypothetical protein
MTTTTTKMPTEEDFTAAIEKLDATYGGDAEAFISIIETVRDEEAFHDVEDGKCIEDCMGCLTERIAVAVTRAVTDKKS